jgi:hypothetical protein
MDTSTSPMFWGVLFIFRMHNYSYFRLGKMWRYKMGKQKPLMEGQTIKCRKEKGQKDKQWSSKHCTYIIKIEQHEPH